MAYCPRPNVREALYSTLPAGTFGFLLACKGPLSTVACTRADLCLEGCPAGDAFIPIQIKWEDVVSQGWIAPGGNRYWKTSIPAVASDPRVAAVLRLLAGRSASAFVEIWGRNTGATMASVMAGGSWVPSFGIMTVPVQPKPQESPAAFVARGGYLLDLRPGFSPILGGKVWQAQGPGFYPWLVDLADLRSIELWGNYDAAAGKLNYTLRAEYRGTWEHTVEAVSASIARTAASFCGRLAENVGSAMAVSTAFPAAAPYMSVYTAALTVCQINASQIQPAPCVARKPRPEDLMAVVGNARVVLTGGAGGAGGKAAISVQVPGITASPATVSGAIAPLPPSPPSPYPNGTIAWRDPSTAGYSLAVPAPGAGVTHRVVLMGVTALPPGVHVVDRGEWERSTLPWVRRRTSKLGLMAAGVVVAVVGTAAAVRH